MKSKSKNKQAKSAILFDEENRAKYLLGFHKRKLERKEKAKKELEERIKEEKKRQREIKAQMLMDERKKSGVPIFADEVKLNKQDVIETEDSTIVISDFGTSFTAPAIDSEVADEIKQSEIKDAHVVKSKSKLSKENSLINEKLTKLEKQMRSLEGKNKKQARKKALKMKNSARNFKSTRKFNVKEKKKDLKEKIKNNKKS